MALEGVVVVASPHDAPETLARLERAITRRGNGIFARIDHSAAAKRVGMALRPTTLVVFGNPAVGTLLMQEAQTVGLDLPLKVLVWEDANGKVQLAYNAPAWISERNGATSDPHGVVKAMTEALRAIVEEAARDGTSERPPA